MRNQAYVRAAAAVLSAALVTGGVLAQTSTPEKMTDTAPPPPEDRASAGAIVLMDEPVLAQREAMTQMAERSGVDTRAMGAGPAPKVLQRDLTKEEIEQQRLLETLRKPAAR